MPSYIFLESVFILTYWANFFSQTTDPWGICNTEYKIAYVLFQVFFFLFALAHFHLLQCQEGMTISLHVWMNIQRLSIAFKQTKERHVSTHSLIPDDI